MKRILQGIGGAALIATAGVADLDSPNRFCDAGVLAGIVVLIYAVKSPGQKTASDSTTSG